MPANYEETYNDFKKQFSITVPFEDLQSTTAIVPKGFIDLIKIGYDLAVQHGAIACTFEEYTGMVLISGVFMANVIRELQGGKYEI